MARPKRSGITGSRTFSVSISDLNLLKWMDGNPAEIPSLSGILRDSLSAIKNQWEIDNDENLEELRTKIQSWRKIVDKQREFLEKKGLIDQFIDFDNGNQSEIIKKELETFEKPLNMIQEKDTNLNKAELTKEDKKKVLGVEKK